MKQTTYYINNASHILQWSEWPFETYDNEPIEDAYRSALEDYCRNSTDIDQEDFVKEVYKIKTNNGQVLKFEVTKEAGTFDFIAQLIE
jgi:hypothetical protein